MIVEREELFDKITWDTIYPIVDGSGFIITSSNGCIFFVFSPLRGEFIGHRWIPLSKATDGDLWCFLWSAPEQTVEQTIFSHGYDFMIINIMATRISRDLTPVQPWNQASWGLHGALLGLTWDPSVGPMNLSIWESFKLLYVTLY